MAFPAITASVFPQGYIAPAAAKWLAAAGVKKTLIASTVTGGIFIPIALTACWGAYRIIKYVYVEAPANEHEKDMRNDELAELRAQIRELQEAAQAA